MRHFNTGGKWEQMEEDLGGFASKLWREELPSGQPRGGETVPHLRGSRFSGFFSSAYVLG